MAEKILVVDDDPDLLAVIKGVLSDEGYEVSIAPDGAAGLKSMAAGPPDLVVLDIMMPDLNGMEVFKKMKTHPTVATIPVIFLTALDERKYIRAALLAGANRYLTKPFENDDLIEAVRQTLNDEF